MFTRAIATEFRDKGIRCNAVCPGFIKTAHGIRELKELRSFGVNVTEEDIIKFCRDNMARYKAPRKVVFGPLPKTSTGKILKFELRDRAKRL